MSGTQPREWEQRIDRVRNSADNAANSFRAMFAGFVGFSAVKSIATIADEMQSLQARIGMLPQTVGDASDAFDTVADRASKARASIDAYGSFYIKLQNAGKKYIKTQEEGLQITDTITKALVVGGATAQEQSSALLQFGQAIGSGVFQGDEFRAMAEAAPQFMDELANALGHPREELKKLSSAGKITAKDVIEATKKMSSVFEERFKNMPMTIGQSMVIIGNRWDMFINKLNRKSGTVTKIADFFLKGFDKIEAGLDHMVDFFGGATNTIKFFGLALAAALSPFVIEAFAGALAFLVSPLGLIMAGLLAIFLIGEDIYQWMNGGKSVIGAFVANFKIFGTIAKKIGEFRDKIAESFNTGLIAKFIAAIVRLGEYLFKVIPFKQILTSLGFIINGILTMIIAVIDVIAGVFKIVLGVLTGDWDLFYEGIKQVFSGLLDFVIGLLIAVFGVFRQFMVFIGTMFRIGFDAIKSLIVDSIFGGIVDAAKRGWNFIKSIFGGSVSANIQANAASQAVTPATVAGAAAAPAGVPGGAAGGTTNVTVNQELPPGTPFETSEAAKNGITQAFSADQLARRMGQLQ